MTFDHILKKLRHHSSNLFDLLQESNEARMAAGLLTVTMIFGTLWITTGKHEEGTFKESAPKTAELVQDDQGLLSTYLSEETRGSEGSFALTDEARSARAKKAYRTLETSFTLAFSHTPTEGLGYVALQIDHMRALRNFLMINIETTLDSTSDRSNAYLAYVSRIKSLGQQATTDIESIDNELILLRSEFTRLENELSQINDNYTVALGNYDPVQTEALLQQYTALQADKAEVFSTIKALESIRNNYLNLTNLAGRHLTFVEANKDALIKNVSVVNVEGVENDLIQSEAQWRSSL